MMPVVIDYSRRFYVVLSNEFGTVRLLERGSAGPDELRRNSGEVDCIAVRHIAEFGTEERKGFEDLFDLVDNVSAGELIHKWLEANHWPMTAEAREWVARILYIEDTVSYLQDRAGRRNPEKALERAAKIRRRGDRHVDDSVPEKYVFKLREKKLKKKKGKMHKRPKSKFKARRL